MSHQLFTNNAGSTLAGAINAVATTCLLQAGTGALFPNPTAYGQFFQLTFVDAATGTRREVVTVTARSGDTLTIIRGQEGTAAQSWSAGDYAQSLVTAAALTSFAQSDTVLAAAGEFVVDAGSANLVSITLIPTPVDLTSIAGAPIRVRRGVANTGPMLIQVNTSIGVVTKNLVNAGGAPMINGQLPNPCMFIVAYDQFSDVFRLLSNVLPLDINLHTTGQLPISRVSGIWQPLTADAIFYVNASTGNDSNPGTISQPWLTLQHAIDYLVSNIDLAGHTATVMATGIFTQGITNNIAWRGGSATNIVIQFQTGAQVNVTNGSCFTALSANCGFTLTSVGTPPVFNASGTGNGQGFAIVAGFECDIWISGPVTFGTCSVAHIGAFSGNVLVFTPNYYIGGSATMHLEASTGGRILFEGPSTGVNIPIASGLSFSTAFAIALNQSLISVPSSFVAFAATPVTGPRYSISDLSLIQTFGGGALFFPGSTPGTSQNSFNYN